MFLNIKRMKNGHSRRFWWDVVYRRKAMSSCSVCGGTPVTEMWRDKGYCAKPACKEAARAHVKRDPQKTF